MELFLDRRVYHDRYTAGILHFGEGELKSTFATIEQPWRGNIASRSCIPCGLYAMRADDTGKHQWFTLDGVPDRTYIEMHPLGAEPDYNGFAQYLQGCICIGYDHHELQSTGELFVTRTMDAITEFQEWWQEEEIEVARLRVDDSKAGAHRHVG